MMTVRTRIVTGLLSLTLLAGMALFTPAVVGAPADERTKRAEESQKTPSRASERSPSQVSPADREARARQAEQMKQREQDARRRAAEAERRQAAKQHADRRRPAVRPGRDTGPLDHPATLPPLPFATWFQQVNTLDLTEAQQKDIRELTHDFRKRMVEFQEMHGPEMRQLQLKMRELQRADAEETVAIRRRLASLFAEMPDINKLRAAIASTLTEQQTRALALRVREIQQRLAEEQAAQVREGRNARGSERQADRPQPLRRPMVRPGQQRSIDQPQRPVRRAAPQRPQPTERRQAPQRRPSDSRPR